MDNLKSARDAFLKEWFGKNWSEDKTPLELEDLENKFNIAFAAAVKTVSDNSENVKVEEYQVQDSYGYWNGSNKEAFEQNEFSRALVNLNTYEADILKQDIFTQVWKKAFEEMSVKYAKLVEYTSALEVIVDKAQDKLNHIRGSYSENYNLNSQIEKDQAFINAIEEMVHETDRSKIIDVLVKIGEKASRWDRLKSNQTAPSMAIDNSIEARINMYQDISDKLSASEDNELIRYGDLFSHLVRDYENLHNKHLNAIKVLEPFAKTGTLFKRGVTGYNETVFAPAAGSEYNLTGNDLRLATSFIYPDFVWIMHTEKQE